MFLQERLTQAKRYSGSSLCYNMCLLLMFRKTNGKFPLVFGNLTTRALVC